MGASTHRRPGGDYAATLAAIAGLVGAAAQKIGAGDTARETDAATKSTLGIGIPGSLSPDDVSIRNANSTWFNGRPCPAANGGWRML